MQLKQTKNERGNMYTKWRKGSDCPEEGLGVYSGAHQATKKTICSVCDVFFFFFFSFFAVAETFEETPTHNGLIAD